MEILKKNITDNENDIDNDSGSGSGSESSNIFINNTHQENKDTNNLMYIVPFIVGFSPIIILFLVVIFCILKNIVNYYIYQPIKKCCNCIKKYNNKQELKILPIYNNKLNPLFIDKLNNTNIKKIEEFNDINCSICLEPIEIDSNKNDTISLNCLHSFHIKCLNNWVKNKLENYSSPNCPLCRNEFLSSYKISKNGNDSSDYNSDFFDNL